MIILLNALSARRGGGQTYITNLLQNMEGFTGTKVYVLAPDSFDIPRHEKIERLRVAWPTENPLLRTVWESLGLPVLLKRKRVDVLFCPGGLINRFCNGPYKRVTMFRNMMPFDRKQRVKYPLGLMRIRNWILERLMLQSMISADLVIFISEFARSFIQEIARGRLRHHVTIPHGIPGHFLTADGQKMKRPEWLPRKGYLLYVSIFDVYKNQIEIVRAYGRVKKQRPEMIKLILAGQYDNPYGKRVLAEIDRLDLGDHVIVPGKVDYNQLPAVYHHAVVNIFASECENCPNILLEAIGAGKPIMASDCQPMPEFGKDAASYFAPDNVDDIAETLLRIIDSPAMQTEMSHKTRDLAKQYNWTETARRTWQEIVRLSV